MCAPEVHQNDCSYVCELSGSPFEELSMVGSYVLYAQDLKKPHNSQNWGVGACVGMGDCVGQYIII